MSGMLNRVAGNSAPLKNLQILQSRTQAPVQANKRHRSSSWQQKNERSAGGGAAVAGDQCLYSGEPTSVLDRRSPSPTSTLSSSFGGSSESGAVAAVSGPFCEAVSDGQLPDPLPDSKDQPQTTAPPAVAPPAFSSSSSSGGGGGAAPWGSKKTNKGSNWRLSSGDESRGEENKPEAFVKEDPAQAQAQAQGQGHQQQGRAEEWVSELGEFQTSGAANAAATAGMEDFESMLLLESATPAPDQSLIRWLLGESDDLKDLPPAMLPHIKGGPAHFDDAMDSNFADPGSFAFPTNSFGDAAVAHPSTPSLLHPQPNPSTFCPPYPTLSPLPRLNNSSHLISMLSPAPPSPTPPPPLTFAPNVSALQLHEAAEPHVLYGPAPTSTFFKDPSQNSAPPSSNNIFFPLPYDMPVPSTPQPPKRLHGVLSPPPLLWQPQGSIPVVKQEFMFKPQHPDIFRHHQQQQQQQQVLLPQFQRPKGGGGGGGGGMGMLSTNAMKHGSEELQQAILGQLLKAAEAVELGTFAQAQAILARLNQHLSPLGKPLERAAFYFKEALTSRIMNTNTGAGHIPSPTDIVHKISAYKCFSEVSPVSQFANFTANQALLESLEGADAIHIVDMEIGLGGQWASFLKELTLRMGGPPSLRITALGSRDSLELHLARENLHHFAKELNVKFEFNVLDLDGRFDALSLPMLHLRDGEVVAVNLSLGMQRFLAGFGSAESVVGFLRLMKELSPKALVVVDPENDRPAAAAAAGGGSLAVHLWDSLQFYAYLFDSLEADSSLNMDAVHKIEKFLMAPKIEGLVVAGTSPAKGMAMVEKLPPWRSLFMAADLTPMPFSNFTETQAEYLVRRLPRGFDVVKDHATLLLGWQGRPLVSASLWRCC